MRTLSIGCRIPAKFESVESVNAGNSKLPQAASADAAELHSSTVPNVLLVTNALEDPPSGGRALLSKLNHDVLLDIYGSSVTVLEASKKLPREACLM